MMKIKFLLAAGAIVAAAACGTQALAASAQGGFAVSGRSSALAKPVPTLSTQLLAAQSKGAFAVSGKSES
jgi:hypothetical protein